MERIVPVLMAVALMLSSCGTQRKLRTLERESAQAYLSIGKDDAPPPEIPHLEEFRDTLEFLGPDGRKVTIMNAVRDENGEMVANDIIDAAVVTARFRNVAERHGAVDLKFDISVPSSMLDDRWQVRLLPTMKLDQETVALDSILITGASYRRRQLRGYQLYGQFLRSIITDSMDFVNVRALEIFLQRNLPELYRFKTDSSYVDDGTYESLFGVNRSQAVEHYTNSFKIRLNDWKVLNSGRVFSSLVKAPVIDGGIRLDTVVRSADGNVIYTYVQHLNVPPGLTRADISLSGKVFRQSEKMLDIPESAPITFYISTLGTLVEDRQRYLTRIVERRAEANSVCWIEFAQGSAVVDTTLGHNADEIRRIRSNIESLLHDDVYDLDSMMVTASCSPEGQFRSNEDLSLERSRSVAAYFKGISHLEISSRNIPENWEMLEHLLSHDDSIPENRRAEIMHLIHSGSPDEKEARLASEPEYGYIRSSLYPLLRTVEFDFYLHRKGMVRDTVITTEPDTSYMRGLRAIKEKDYPTALALLRPYDDINTAIAYCLMDYDASAMDVLSRLEPCDKKEYLMALLYSRSGDDALAVQHFVQACSLNPAFVHRGNLDPEIAQLIDKYDLINNLTL